MSTIDRRTFIYEETRLNPANDREYVGYWKDGTKDVLTIDEDTGETTASGCKLALRIRRLVVREDFTDPVMLDEIALMSSAQLIENLPAKKQTAA